MKNPTSTPLYVRAVYSATCNSGLVGVYSPGLAFIVRSVLSFHFELDWVVIRSWLCLQLMQSERNITFTSQYLKSKSRNLFIIFLIHYVPPKFSDLTTALRLDPKLNYFKINSKHAICTAGAFFKKLYWMNYVRQTRNEYRIEWDFHLNLSKHYKVGIEHIHLYFRL